MSISYPITFPTQFVPKRVVIKSRSVVGVSESPFTLQQQVYAHPGGALAMDVQYPPMERADAEDLIGALLSLNGREGTFLYGDPSQSAPRNGSPSLENYLSLPGESDDYASTQDSVANSITGDIDIRVKVSFDDWTSASEERVIAKYTSGAGRLFNFGHAATTGKLEFDWFDAAGNSLFILSSVAPGFTNGTAHWIRVTLDVDDGAGNRVGKFYTSEDGVTWTQLGTTTTTAGTTDIRDGSVDLTISNSSGNLATGKVYRAQIYNGIAGTLAVDFDPSRASPFASSFVAVTGETWTINTSGSPRADIIQGGGVVVDGASQTGRTLAVRGLRPEQTAVFKAGDWIQLGSGSSTHLHKIVQDTDSDVNGAADLEITPRLRTSPADGAAVTYTSPLGQWRLASNETEWDIDLAKIYGLRFSAVEAL